MPVISVQARGVVGRRVDGDTAWKRGAMAESRSEGAFVALPDPGQAETLDELVDRLRVLKVWAGNPSYLTITDRINTAWTAAGRPATESAKRGTVVDCFKPGRRRLNVDLVIAVVRSLHPDMGYVAQWRQALRVVSEEVRAASQVRVHDTLPPEMDGFTGRTAELDQLRRALDYDARGRGVVVISAIVGMAGVGKTQLALHAGHLFLREKLFDRVLLVDLRGFHPDPAQPPADPAAVLDGFLRLLGVSGHQIPHDLPARIAAYRARLAGTRTLVILDNAADEDQVRPLLPGTAGCPVLVTSRRSLTALRPASHLTVDVFTPEEAQALLAGVAAGIPAGLDPDAPARIAERCGYLPLALGLVAGHIRGASGWTLTDHAERLDERHRERKMDSGVKLALDLSYRHLPADRRRLLRLAALHPGHDLDAYAAAALTGNDLATAQALMHRLCRDHLLQPSTPGRYTFHDLVRAYAIGLASDEDPQSCRRTVLTRLFDYYLATSAAAMDTLHPAEAHRRPRIPTPGTSIPALAGTDTARAWLDTERPTLIAVAAHTAAHGWPTHATRLSATLYRYLAGGYLTDALVVHGHALHAAQHFGDPAGQAHALTNLGATHIWLGRHGPAAKHLRQALHLYRQTDDQTGQARALNNLGDLDEGLSRYRSATDHYEQALALHRQAGDRTGEARSLGKLGLVQARLGQHGAAADRLQQALTLFRQAGDRSGEADALANLGDDKAQLGRYGPAANLLQQALTLHRQLGNRAGEAWALDSLGILHTRLGQPDQAIEHHQQALSIHRETSDRAGQAWALNGLGEAAQTAGRPTDALTHHTAAHALAADIEDLDQQARAHTGLSHAHDTLNNTAQAGCQSPGTVESPTSS